MMDFTKDFLHQQSCHSDKQCSVSPLSLVLLVEPWLECERSNDIVLDSELTQPQHEFSSLTPLVTLPKFNCLFKSCHDMPADVIANYFGHQFVKPTANIQRRKGQVPPLGVNPVQQNLQANEGYSRGMFWAAIEVPVVYDDGEPLRYGRRYTVRVGGFDRLLLPVEPKTQGVN